MSIQADTTTSTAIVSMEVVALYRERHRSKPVTKCRRCRLQSDKTFCQACLHEFERFAATCFNRVNQSLASFQNTTAASFYEHRDAYRKARKQFRAVVRLKMYGVTFALTQEYRVRLRAAKKALAEAKQRFKLERKLGIQ